MSSPVPSLVWGEFSHDRDYNSFASLSHGDGPSPSVSYHQRPTLRRRATSVQPTSRNDEGVVKDKWGVVVRCRRPGHEDTYLVVKQLQTQNGFWGFCKGSQEDSDEVEGKEMDVSPGLRCAQRELGEEAGLYIDINALANATHVVTQPARRYGARKYHYFLVEVDHELECRVDPKEIETYAWFTLSQLRQIRAKASFTTNMVNRLIKLQSHSFIRVSLIPMAPRWDATKH